MTHIVRVVLKVMDKVHVLSAVQEKSSELGLELDLVLAFVEVESSFNPLAHRFEPGWKYFLPADSSARLAAQNGLSLSTELNDQATSFGCLQIMGSVARELGFTGNLAELYDTERGLHYGCLKLKRELARHANLGDAISSYNQGSPRKADGAYLNQAYVDKVLNAYLRNKENP